MHCCWVSDIRVAVALQKNLRSDKSNQRPKAHHQRRGFVDAFFLGKFSRSCPEGRLGGGDPLQGSCIASFCSKHHAWFCRLLFCVTLLAVIMSYTNVTNDWCDSQNLRCTMLRTTCKGIEVHSSVPHRCHYLLAFPLWQIPQLWFDSPGCLWIM